MLTDNNLLYTRGNDGINGVAIAWVIEGEVPYCIPTWQEFADMFMFHDEIVDISLDYPDHDGITVRFIKNGEVINELQTTEYFGSILLSNPLAVKTLDYAYGRYVMGGDATFDGEKFTITNRDLTGYLPFHPHSARALENENY
jgi:hypothetical protein